MLTIHDIKDAVSHEFGIPPIEMVSARRFRGVARPRQVAMYLSKEMTPHSLSNIGRLFGGRDHKTVSHAISQIETLAQTDIVLRAKIARLKADLSPAETLSSEALEEA